MHNYASEVSWVLGPVCPPPSYIAVGELPWQLFLDVKFQNGGSWRDPQNSNSEAKAVTASKGKRSKTSRLLAHSENHIIFEVLIQRYAFEVSWVLGPLCHPPYMFPGFCPFWTAPLLHFTNILYPRPLSPESDVDDESHDPSPTSTTMSSFGMSFFNLHQHLLVPCAAWPVSDVSHTSERWPVSAESDVDDESHDSCPMSANSWYSIGFW